MFQPVRATASSHLMGFRPNKADGVCFPFYFPESGASEGHFLSKEILRHIRQQHCEEYAMCNGNHHNPQPTDVFSTEPDLLISDSELPRPLRSDAFWNVYTWKPGFCILFGILKWTRVQHCGLLPFAMCTVSHHHTLSEIRVLSGLHLYHYYGSTLSHI